MLNFLKRINSALEDVVVMIFGRLLSEVILLVVALVWSYVIFNNDSMYDVFGYMSLFLAIIQSIVIYAILKNNQSGV